MAKANRPITIATSEMPGPSDAYAGAQLRAARTALNWSQGKLGEIAGVSFQQVQKYESGKNRIAFSTLQKFAVALNLPIDHFLPDAPSGQSVLAAPVKRTDYIASNQPDAAELLRLYEGLGTDAARAQLLQAARDLVEKTRISKSKPGKKS